MNVTVNGEPQTATGTLADLLAGRLGDASPPGVAVAVNGDVVPRAQWPVRPLRVGDAVEVVTAVQGG